MNDLFQKIVLGDRNSQSILKSISILQSDNQSYIKEKQIIQIKIKSLPKQIQAMIESTRFAVKNSHNDQEGLKFQTKKQQMKNQLQKINIYESVAQHLKDIIQKYIKVMNTVKDKQNKQNQALLQLSGFIHQLNNLQIYVKPQTLQENNKSNVVDYSIDIQSKLKINVSKIAKKCEQILSQICKKFVSVKNNFQLIIIQKKSIENSLQILKNKTQICQDYLKILLSNCVSYDIQYQLFIFLKITNIQQTDKQIRVTRQKISFKKQDAQNYIQQIVQTLIKHVYLSKQIQKLTKNSFKQNQNTFISHHFSQIKSNLQYIIPYLSLKNRKKLFKAIAQESQVLKFQDLLIRLKSKNQEVQLFSSTLQDIFKQLISTVQNKSVFNQLNFDLLMTFLQLSIYEAEQSIIATSSKALTKLTKTQIGKQKKVSESHKKMLNIILLTSSDLIQKIEQVEGQDKQADEWVNKLLWVRQNVRRKIHLNDE